MKEPNRIINIGRGQRNVRYVSAAVGLLIALGLALFLVVSGTNRLWRLLVYFPLAVAGASFYEARDQVCSLLAHRGECSLDQGFYVNKTIRGEKIGDSTLVQQLRRQGTRVAIKGQIFAIGLTALFVILPI